MASPLTVRSTPAELADRKQVIETKENIDSFPRLAAILGTELSAARTPLAKWRQFPVEITLRFGWAGGRREFVTVTGTVTARIAALCNRCLQPFVYPVREELKLLLVHTGDATGEEPGHETWELDEEFLRPADIVEEILIMALPLAPRHDDETICRPEATAAPAAERGNTIRPFADLKSQMQD
ncbi:MAG: DUF177 domain-containing protein [Woeseiaceae bacterium]|nr:DUF177 domain-containing protein [Woeseiaceae bacterium]